MALARLEEWMRRYYHRVDHDIGSSGVQDLTMGELKRLCGFALAELDLMVFHDSESFGGPRLRAALADRWTGGDIDPVMVTHGSSEAIYIVMHTLLEPGDEVVVVDPIYPQLSAIAEAMGCRITRWSLRGETGFAVDLDRLRALAARRPRMIVVNFPHNPTGLSLTPDQQRALVEIAAGCGAWLVWDHAFGELTYAAEPLPLPRWYDRSICFGTFSKSYGLAGLRVGWCLAPPDLLARMVVLRDYIALYVSPILEFFAEQAVRHADLIVARQQAHAAANLAQLLAWAAPRADLVRLQPPDGGVTTLIQVPSEADMTLVCHELAERHRVLLVPGECFGDGYQNWARLGFGGSSAELAAGLGALAEVLAGERRLVPVGAVW